MSPESTTQVPSEDQLECIEDKNLDEIGGSPRPTVPNELTSTRPTETLNMSNTMTSSSSNSSNSNRISSEVYMFTIDSTSYQDRNKLANKSIGTGLLERVRRSPSSRTSHKRSNSEENSEGNKAVNEGEEDSDCERSSPRDKSPSPQRSISLRSHVFMRSKPVTTVLELQLFSTPNGVYRRLALYGMEGLPSKYVAYNDSATVVGSTTVRSGGEEDPLIREDKYTGAKEDHSTRYCDDVKQENPPSPTVTKKRKSVQFKSQQLMTERRRSESPSSATVPSPSKIIPIREGSDCLICFSNKQDTLMFPCRHMCICKCCASLLAAGTGQFNNASRSGEIPEKKCPVCRKPVLVMLHFST